jgi:hypothetical protein
VGNVAAAALIDYRRHDGANQLGDEPGSLTRGKGIEGRFVLWGAQRRRSSEKGLGSSVTHRVDIEADFADVSLKFTDAKGKPTSEASFGIPAGAYVPYPEQKNEDFPPLAYIGGFAFPLFTFEAQKAEIELAVTSRSGSGQDIVATFKWNREIPAEWRLKEGEKWEGASEEEREELAEPTRRR